MTHFFFFFQAEDGIRDVAVTGVQTCALPIYLSNVVFSTSVIEQGKFGGANLTRANFNSADLFSAIFTNANATQAIFRSADLTRANFRDAITNGADFTGAIFNNTIMPDGSIRNF